LRDRPRTIRATIGPTEASSGGTLKTYVTLTLLSTLASSFIWGINTLFLLDAGLTVTEAFAANAFFTAGQVLFEVPTGVVADTVGRRASYLLGAATLFASTLFYLLLWQLHGPFWSWALASVLLGLGFSFFSGATEAWLVDGLRFTQYSGTLESAFAKGQIASGAAMLVGSVAGGVVAQWTSLGVPYLLRAVLLGVTFLVALVSMRDLGFEPQKRISVAGKMRDIVRSSLRNGLQNPPVRWLMLAAPFTGGVGIYAFYAMQPFLLELYGRNSYSVAGVAAAMMAGAQILGGSLVPHLGRLVRLRTSFLLAGGVTSTAALALLGVVGGFAGALVLLGLWALVFAATTPVRQAFINGLIPSEERATILSSDNLLASSGGVLVQPALGRAADVWGYASSYVVASAVTALAVPFVWLARRERAASDPIAAPTRRR
jgi:MFS family permease